jgi:hypothetical protein
MFTIIMKNTIFSYTTIYLKKNKNKTYFIILILPETFLTTIGLPVRLAMIAIIVNKCRNITVFFLYRRKKYINASYLYVYLYVIRR